MTLVFVFGALKKGFPLHEAGLRGATYRGRFRTVQRYPMLVAGPSFAAMLLHEPGVGRQVKGELYEVDDAMLSALDALESVGQPGHLRVTVAVEPLDGDQVLSAQAYAKTRELARPAHTGYLEDYQDRRFKPPTSAKGG